MKSDIIEMDNQQPSSSACKDGGKGSTTISQESTGVKTGKRSVYLRKKNVIYKILNTVNNKFYIGSAAHYDKRIGSHVANLRRNKHKNIYLQRAWNKHYEKMFTFEIIEEVDSKYNLTDREQYYLDLYTPYKKEIGYNICDKASRNRFGMKMPESAKIKIGNYWRGKKWSTERVEKTRKKVGLVQGKAVIVYDENKNLLSEHISMSETARTYGISVSCVHKYCNNKVLKNKLNYIFKYKT